MPHAGAPIVLHGHIPDFRSSSEGGIWSCRGLDPVFKRSCGLMDKASVFGTKDCRFESCQDHRIAAGRSDRPSVSRGPVA